MTSKEQFRVFIRFKRVTPNGGPAGQQRAALDGIVVAVVVGIVVVVVVVVVVLVVVVVVVVL